MGLVSRFIGQGGARNDKSKDPTTTSSSLTDGALDTLGSVMRTFGDLSFPLDDPSVLPAFREDCAAFACHVENGAAVPVHEIPQSAAGQREWAAVRRFFADRRHDEKLFVTERLSDYRGVVGELVDGLRQIGQRDQDTETAVRLSLDKVEKAAEASDLPTIKAALGETIRTVTDTFARQKLEYEQQISELNQRMSGLRQDLVATREEMKRDPLTQAYNRGAFDTAIAQSVNLNFLLRQPVTIVLLDIDRFKFINDTYGHSAGDEVLSDIGKCLERSFIRKSDLVARFGGDEFAVILNDTTAGNSVSLINRFVQSLRDIRIPYAGDDIRVTCSAGYTEIAPGDGVKSVMKRVDEALYTAKHAGRDRVEFAPPPSA
ncbi:MAG: GGDEF domain-containing protein [Gammaproteobacteria bacterium]|nr:GGDEF domain-containing protein [Gammaproteobacteria bacterium]MDH4313281.1 GGDEF domain-containing protein [Gammaproteobacteria bacterium]MDH5212918.1 GGDEF domain-containing protein [Gammaproteobacteria bacterium]MDH5499475.1 GGDEF domain-containing protein [Gammaproteobacteria bacterium]